MTKSYFHEKISLSLILLILSNYLFLYLNVPQLVLKINFVLFLTTIILFYTKNFLENYFLKLSFLFIIFISLGTAADGWDARSIWLFQAKKIFYENSLFSIVDNYAPFSHNNYPLLSSSFAASFATLVGYWNEVFPKIAFTLIFLPPLIISWSFFKNSNYLIFLSIVFFTIGNYLFNGWSDGIVAIYFGLTALLMYLLIISDENLFKDKLLFYILLFCFSITLTLVKNEGVPLLAIIFFTTFIIKLYKREFKKDFLKLLTLSLSFIPILTWKYFCFTNDVASYAGFGEDYLNADTISNLLHRSSDFTNYQMIFYFLFLNEKFLVPFLFFLIAFKQKWNKELFIFTSSIFILYTIVLFIVFLSTPHDFVWQLNTAAVRLIKSFNFLLAFFALYNLCGLKVKN